MYISGNEHTVIGFWNVWPLERLYSILAVHSWMREKVTFYNRRKINRLLLVKIIFKTLERIETIYKDSN